MKTRIRFITDMFRIADAINKTDSGMEQLMLIDDAERAYDKQFNDLLNQQNTPTEPKSNNKGKLIDKVTTSRLNMALRMVGVQLNIELIDNIIDLVELIEDKGENASLKDVSKLQEGWI